MNDDAREDTRARAVHDPGALGYTGEEAHAAVVNAEAAVERAIRDDLASFEEAHESLAGE